MLTKLLKGGGALSLSLERKDIGTSTEVKECRHQEQE